MLSQINSYIWHWGGGALIFLVFTIQVLLLKKVDDFNLLNGFKIKKRGCINYFVLNVALRKYHKMGLPGPTKVESS